MSQEATNRFQDELSKLIDYFTDEMGLTFAEAIGVLEIAKADLIKDLIDPESD